MLRGSYGKADQFLFEYLWPQLSDVLQKTILELGLHEGRQTSERFGHELSKSPLRGS